MAQEIPNGDLPVRRNGFYLVHPEKQQLRQERYHAHTGMKFIPLVGTDPHMGKLRQVFGKRVIQTQYAVFHQLQDTDSRHDLGHGGYAKNRIICHRSPGSQVGKAPFPVINDFIILADEQGTAGHFPVL